MQLLIVYRQQKKTGVIIVRCQVFRNLLFFLHLSLLLNPKLFFYHIPQKNQKKEAKKQEKLEIR